MPKLWSLHVNRGFKMNNMLKIIGLTSVLCVASCSPESVPNTQTDEKADLVEQLADLKPSAVLENDNIPGDTDAEKLMYVLDVATATKSGILIFLDTQIESFEAIGNTEEAAALRQNRVWLTQAADEKIEIFIKEAAKVYEAVFTPEEIKTYLEVFSRPEMQKYSRTTIALQQEMLPVATRWSEDHVVPRYVELIEQQAGK